MKRFTGNPEDYSGQKFEWPVLKSFIPRCYPYKWSLLLCGLILVISSLLSIILPLLVRHAIDVNFTNKDLKGLLITVGLYVLVVFLSFIFNYFQRIELEIIGQNIIKKIRIDIFSHITKLPQSFFDKNPVGQMLSRIENDTETLRQMYTFTSVMIISDFLMMIGMIVVMFSINLRLTLVLLSISPFIIFIIFYFNGRIVPIFIEVRKKTADIYAFLEEYIRGVRIVQAFSQEENVIRKMDSVNKAKVDAEYPGENLSNYFGHLIFFLSILATSLILGIGGFWTLQRPDLLTIGTLVAFLGYIQRFFGPIFHLSEQINIIQKAFAGLKRIKDILDTPVQDHRKTSKKVVSSDNKKGIEFKNVWFAYKNEEWVLKDVSFFIPEGKKLAIVGPTGSGKSTIINLILRFYEPLKGQILIDGIDINTISLHKLRNKIGLVLQDIVLFPVSVIDNLRLENNMIKEEKVIHAIEVVKAGDIIDRLGGLDAVLSEQGSNMSMGERQLMSFARALVFDPEILILDEATSSVDPFTEQRLQTAVETILKGRTAIIIAHRLQTILECNKIIVLQNGIIEERGTHEELLKLKGLYWNLYELQFGETSTPDLSGSQLKQID